jgi:uncharacterized surface protein with fasciclin (FAS1) repeats
VIASLIVERVTSVLMEIADFMSSQDQTIRSQGTGPVGADLATQSIFDTLQREPDFRALVSAVQEAGLEHVLRGIGPITLLAPTDFDPSKAEDVRDLLEAHIVEGRQLVADLKTVKRLRTRAGTFIPVAWTREKVTLGDAVITRSDITCTNGAVQVIDRTLHLEPAPTP